MDIFSFRRTPKTQRFTNRTFAVVLFLAFIILLQACNNGSETTGSTINTPESTSIAARPDTPDSLIPMPDEGASSEFIAAESPCDLTLERTGEEVKVAGQIVFVEDSLRAGIFAKLSQTNCTVGLFVDRDYWNNWNDDHRVLFTVGAWVESEGYLGAYLGELEVQITSPLVAMDGTQVAGPALIHMTPCEITSGNVGDSVRLSGYISFIDYSDPNGQFAELDGDGCRAGLWVDLEEILAWPADAQALFQVSASVIVEGTLTSFDGEMILELNIPPYQ